MAVPRGIDLHGLSTETLAPIRHLSELEEPVLFTLEHHVIAVRDSRPQAKPVKSLLAMGESNATSESTSRWASHGKWSIVNRLAFFGRLEFVIWEAWTRKP